MARIRIKFPDGRVFAELDEETSFSVRLYAIIKNKTLKEAIDELIGDFIEGVKNGTVNPRTGETTANGTPDKSNSSNKGNPPTH